MTQKDLKVNGRVGFDGKIKATLAKLDSRLHWNLHNEILKRIKDGRPFMELVRELNRICRVKIFEYQNLTVTAGRTMIANNMCNASPTNAPLITYSAVGTGITAPEVTDTKLVTENTRKVVASRTNSSNTGYISQYYIASEAVASLKETGLF